MPSKMRGFARGGLSIIGHGRSCRPPPR